MLQVGSVLYLVPPVFAGGTSNFENKKRMLLIISINDQDNTITTINVSKIENKPRCFTYPYNCLIRKYNPPFPVPSFAKLNDTYIIENFLGLSQFLYRKGEPLDQFEVKNIIEKRNRIIFKGCIEQITLSEKDIMSVN